MSQITAWYFGQNNEQKGPFSHDQMAALLRAGSITPTTLVWTAGMPGWVPLGQTVLAAGMPGAAPSPGPAAAEGTVQTFGEAVSVCSQKYVTFGGRANRPEYWYYVLFFVCGAVITTIVDMGITNREFGPLYTVFSLVTFLPSLAVTVRRLHDTDRSGWWYLLVLVPVIGWILLLVWWCERGTQGPNRFG